MTRKDVHNVITFDFGRPVAVTDVNIGFNGLVEIKNGAGILKPKAVTVGQLRDRSNDRYKDLFTIPTSGASVTANEASLLSSYQYIFAIDTNTILIDKIPVSFAAIAVCILLPAIDNYRSGFLIVSNPGGYEFHGLAKNQERLAWTLIQDAIVGSPDFDSQAKYLLLTDHAKSRHFAINAREEPLFAEIMLAENITLGFATSDSGNSLSQKVLRSCDRNAKAFLRDLRARRIPNDYVREFSHGPIHRFRGVENRSVSWPEGVPRFRLSKDTPLIDRFAEGN